MNYYKKTIASTCMVFLTSSWIILEQFKLFRKASECLFNLVTILYKLNLFKTENIYEGDTRAKKAQIFYWLAGSKMIT